MAVTLGVKLVSRQGFFSCTQSTWRFIAWTHVGSWPTWILKCLYITIEPEYDAAAFNRTFTRWSEDATSHDPQFFRRHANQQHPEFLWIGCSDSRVPAEEVLGLPPGHVFVQRNVGNQVSLDDLNAMSCLEYAVTELKVGAILVCGHYRCGAVKTAMSEPPQHLPAVGAWISGIRDCCHMHQAELSRLDQNEQHGRLCELNVLQQVQTLCSSSVVHSAWARQQPLDVYGLIYDITDGMLMPLLGPISCAQDIESKLPVVMKPIMEKDVVGGGDMCSSSDDELSGDNMRRWREQQLVKRYGMALPDSPATSMQHQANMAQNDNSSGSDEEGLYTPVPSIADVFAPSHLYAAARHPVSFPLREDV